MGSFKWEPMHEILKRIGQFLPCTISIHPERKSFMTQVNWGESELSKIRCWTKKKKKKLSLKICIN